MLCVEPSVSKTDSPTGAYSLQGLDSAAARAAGSTGRECCERDLGPAAPQAGWSLVWCFVGCGRKPSKHAQYPLYLPLDQLCPHETRPTHHTVPFFHATHSSYVHHQELAPSPSIESEVEEQPPSLWRRLPFRPPCLHCHCQRQPKRTMMVKRWPKSSKPAGKTWFPSRG